MRRTYLLSLLAAVSTAAAVVPESDLNELDTRAIFGRQCLAACRCPGGEGLSCCVSSTPPRYRRPIMFMNADYSL